MVWQCRPNCAVGHPTRYVVGLWLGLGPHAIHRPVPLVVTRATRPTTVSVSKNTPPLCWHLVVLWAPLPKPTPLAFLASYPQRTARSNGSWPVPSSLHSRLSTDGGCAVARDGAARATTDADMPPMVPPPQPQAGLLVSGSRHRGRRCPYVGLCTAGLLIFLKFHSKQWASAGGETLSL
jgi:hypothetical protein